MINSHDREGDALTAGLVAQGVLGTNTSIGGAQPGAGPAGCGRNLNLLGYT